MPDPNVPRRWAGTGFYKMVDEVELDYSVLSVPNKLGPPRFALGAWQSEPQLRRAVEQYDGWIASGGPGSHYGGWRKMMTEAIKRYRDLGGKRAMVTTVVCDLSMPEEELDDFGSFHLVCGPKSAAERLNAIAELGFDDVVLSFRDARTGSGYGEMTREKLDEVRSLMPKDTRDYRDA
ncbi:MAG: hypothetical protein JO147_00390 [Actinobacteria bacterium]|nr:hypothetical protein [Actinomycetota bacterium]